MNEDQEVGFCGDKGFECYEYYEEEDYEGEQINECQLLIASYCGSCFEASYLVQLLLLVPTQGFKHQYVEQSLTTDLDDILNPEEFICSYLRRRLLLHLFILRLPKRLLRLGVPFSCPSLSVGHAQKYKKKELKVTV
ncbi:MAG: hypothetical protein EZS28_002013 [Streblomastix strix]|uniref:Uncharacterized protein n=1 Tax=Streblomastix strix TaxID=222440 RepID=A0A5J4X611_9EUKA|nr:MAG: hypothetical protein EZS28_002013 [Streblomastix strix]